VPINLTHNVYIAHVAVAVTHHISFELQITTSTFWGCWIFRTKYRILIIQYKFMDVIICYTPGVSVVNCN